LTIAALQRETTTIPIVMTNVTDPVGSGFVAALNRPGGNFTGFAIFETSLGGKLLELLSEIATGLKRVALMYNANAGPAAGIIASFETAAQSLKVGPFIAAVHSDVEIEKAIDALGREPGGGLVVPPVA